MSWNISSFETKQHFWFKMFNVSSVSECKENCIYLYIFIYIYIYIFIYIHIYIYIYICVCIYYILYIYKLNGLCKSCRRKQVEIFSNFQMIFQWSQNTSFSWETDFLFHFQTYFSLVLLFISSFNIYKFGTGVIDSFLPSKNAKLWRKSTVVDFVDDKMWYYYIKSFWKRQTWRKDWVMKIPKSAA